MRAESGPVKFGDDWTGVFFRGDTAHYYGIALKELLAQLPATDDHESSPVLAKIILKGLVNDLLACNEFAEPKAPVQQLLPFDACLPTPSK